MSVIRVTTSFNLEIDFEAPPFHRRLFAWIIDLFILIFYIIIATKILRQIERNMSYSEDNMYNMWAVGLVIVLPFFIYHPVCEILMNGQSVGKRLMGIQVVNENGGKPSVSQYIIRWLIRTSDYMILVIIIYSPYIAIFWKEFMWGIGGAIALLVTDIILVNSRKQQRLGDLLAHTILIKTKQKTSIDDTIFLHIAEGYKASFPQVMQLSDRDINALKSILDAAKKHNDYDLAVHASEKIKTHLKIDTSLPPFEFLEILLKDYNYLAGQ
jgi:uncharacterized RDD family membrane protein YckC